MKYKVNSDRLPFAKGGTVDAKDIPGDVNIPALVVGEFLTPVKPAQKKAAKNDG